LEHERIAGIIAQGDAIVGVCHQIARGWQGLVRGEIACITVISVGEWILLNIRFIVTGIVLAAYTSLQDVFLDAALKIE